MLQRQFAARSFMDLHARNRARRPTASRVSIHLRLLHAVSSTGKFCLRYLIFVQKALKRCHYNSLYCVHYWQRYTNMCICSSDIYPPAVCSVESGL